MDSIVFDKPQTYLAVLWIGTARAWKGTVLGSFRLPKDGEDGLLFTLHEDISAIAPADGYPALHIMTEDGTLLLTNRYPEVGLIERGNIINIEGELLPKSKEINVNEQDQEFADKIGEAVNEFNKLTAEANKRGLRVSLGVQPYNRVGLAPAEVLTAEVTRVVTPRKETPKWEG